MAHGVVSAPFCRYLCFLHLFSKRKKNIARLNNPGLGAERFMQCRALAPHDPTLHSHESGPCITQNKWFRIHGTCPLTVTSIWRSAVDHNLNWSSSADLSVISQQQSWRTGVLGSAEILHKKCTKLYFEKSKLWNVKSSTRPRLLSFQDNSPVEKVETVSDAGIKINK